MKKAYQKPEIMFEDFSLSTNIAGDCGTIIDTQNRDQCFYETRTGLHVFISDLSGCTTKEDDGDYNGICYHIPIEADSLFNS